MAVEKGRQAPVFTLYNSDKSSVSLSDFKEKNVVLLFFPLAFSSTCTAELCSVRDSIALYNNTNTQVLGISIDSLFTLNKFKADQNLNFPLLSDFNKDVASAYGVLYRTFPSFEMNGVSKRAAFVIDKNGVVQYSEVCASPGDQPDFAAIQETLGLLN